ncbi:VOC family protein [Fusobacterium sp. IOR10]|uniref:VOC family protein n=1 Tax=Fusobacterium sp. IOR10 TaxID=2665157 RepID=UPI0013D0AF54|nr:VOC family protein [Fusobacterium sp. IOR10]
MIIEHIAIWTKNIEIMKNFYCDFFNGRSNNMYENNKKGFKSYFITFTNGCRLELMESTNIKEEGNPLTFGIAHIAFKIGSEKEVDKLTDSFRNKGFTIIGNPRTTGDGYYESIILDPEGNTIELVA